MKRCGQLRHLFDSSNLGPIIIIRLYTAAVCSLLTYGCESWTLTNKVLRMLNGANSQMLSRVTGRSVRDEARPNTTIYNLTLAIRKRRFRWLGDILRKYRGTDNILMHAVCIQDQTIKHGNLLIDSPRHESMDQLSQMAQDKAFWNEHSKCIY